MRKMTRGMGIPGKQPRSVELTVKFTQSKPTGQISRYSQLVLIDSRLRSRGFEVGRLAHCQDRV